MLGQGKSWMGQVKDWYSIAGMPAERPQANQGIFSSTNLKKKRSFINTQATMTVMSGWTNQGGRKVLILILASLWDTRARNLNPFIF